METSLFIARLVGPIMIVAGLAALINQKLLEEITREFLESRALLYLAGVLALTTGLVIVNVHNVWIADWPLIITILGWVAIASGVARMAFPNVTVSLDNTILSKGRLLVPLALFQLILGAWLSWVGYA